MASLIEFYGRRYNEPAIERDLRIALVTYLRAERHGDREFVDLALDLHYEMALSAGSLWDFRVKKGKPPWPVIPWHGAGPDVPSDENVLLVLGVQMISGSLLARKRRGRTRTHQCRTMARVLLYMGVQRGTLKEQSLREAESTTRNLITAGFGGHWEEETTASYIERGRRLFKKNPHVTLPGSPIPDPTL